MSTTTALAVQPAEPLPQPAPWWPMPAPAPGPVPLAALAAGVLAAGLVPGGGPGIGWLLAGIGVCAATAIGLRTAPALPRRWQTAAWAAVALVLLAVGAVRAAEWLFWLCLLAAAAATVLALTSGRTVRGLALGALLVPAAAGRGVAWSNRGAATLRRQVRQTVRLAPTVAVTAVVLLVFGGLLASADAGFARLLGRAVPDLSAPAVLRWWLLAVVGCGLVLAAAVLLLSPPPLDRPPAADDGRVRLAEWAAPVAALVGLFAGFVAVQLAVLFGGAGYVRGPDGPTYAEHARGGFWQLLAVTALTLLVIGLVAWLAPRRTPLDRWFLRGLLGTLSLLALVIVASALFRMHTYQEAYGFTRLRIVVSVAELWLGVVFLLVIAAGVRLRSRWLPRAVVAVGIAAVLTLAAVNPDRLIAERNVARWQAGHELDVEYLAGLSADAVPVLACLPDPERAAALARIQADLAAAGGDWRAANLARARADLGRTCVS